MLYPGYERYVTEELGYKQLTDPFLNYGLVRISLFVRATDKSDSASYQEELARFPLLFKPGERFDYGWSNDVRFTICYEHCI